MVGSLNYGNGSSTNLANGAGPNGIGSSASSVTLVDIDEDDVRVLEATLSKVGSLADQITTSLHKLGLSASAAERAIKPISGKAQMLNIYEKNLAASLKVVGGIKDYAKLTEECGIIINAGPEQSGIPEYSKAITRLDGALEELKSSHLRSFYKVIDKAETLRRKGVTSVKDSYRQELARSFKPINAAEYISNKKLFPILPKTVVVNLKQMHVFFDAHQRDGVDEIYFDIASRYILASLASIGANVQKNSLSSTSSQDLSLGANSTNSAQGSNSNGISIYVEALSRLLIAEVTNAQQLFDNDDSITARYFEEISNLSISELFTLTNKISADCLSKRPIAKEAPIAFELLDSITKIISLFQKFSPRAVPARLTQVLHTSQVSVQYVFTDFVKYVETRVDSAQTNVILENGVSDATIEVMTRLKKLSQYRSTELVAIGSLSAGAWLSNPKPRWATIIPSINSGNHLVQERAEGNAVELLSLFFGDCIDALVLSLELKAKALQKKTTQVGFFILTNLEVVEHYITNSDIFKILGNTGAERLEKLRKRGVDMFVESWKSAAALLMDVTILGGGSSGGGSSSSKSLSGKDREIIKEKFRTFNADFEVLVKTHKAYNITNQSLRQQLAKEVRFISPLYHRFYDKHSGGDFSKHVDKYIKYNKQEFDRILESLE